MRDLVVERAPGADVEDDATAFAVLFLIEPDILGEETKMSCNWATRRVQEGSRSNAYWRKCKKGRKGKGKGVSR